VGGAVTKMSRVVTKIAAIAEDAVSRRQERERLPM
jgi:hypothetical protein